MTDLLKRISEGFDKCGVTPGAIELDVSQHAIDIIVQSEKTYYVVAEHVDNEADAVMFAQCREAFKALIAYVYQADRLPPLTAIDGALEDEYKFAIKVIESGTGWTWDEWRRWIDE